MTHPTLPPSVINRVPFTREMFVSSQHYEAWRMGMPLRRHLKQRKKFTRDEKDLFFRHHEYVCSFCPATVMLTIDHIVPQVLGGSSRDCNLRSACLPCNTADWRKYFDRYLRLYDQFMASVAA